jgi:hypothetical protein
VSSLEICAEKIQTNSMTEGLGSYCRNILLLRYTQCSLNAVGLRVCGSTVEVPSDVAVAL